MLTIYGSMVTLIVLPNSSANRNYSVVHYIYGSMVWVIKLPPT